MNFGDSFLSAVRAIAANKLRSALTMLGVIIGVGSVIAMLGIGEGTKQKSIKELEIMGSNRISIMPNWGRGRSSGQGDASTLRREDADRLFQEVPAIKYITGIVSSRGGGNLQVKYRSNSARTSITGALPEVRFIDNATKMFAGEWFTDEDNVLMERKAVLGYQVYDTLFEGENAIGATIRIGQQNFEVVGVVDYKGGSGFMNPDDQIYIPLETAANRLMGTKDRLSSISVQAADSTILLAVQEDIENVLMRTRRSATGEALFRVFNQGESLEMIQTQSRLLGLLLAGIASVSLLVGGIGIMNIMLVSVTERTREIGLRKAIGAQRGSILSQFLLESVVMCVLGGALGVALGYAAVHVVAGQLQVPPVINMPAVLMAFGFSVAVGLFFGLYPAVRASRLQPIDALRYE